MSNHCKHMTKNKYFEYTSKEKFTIELLVACKKIANHPGTFDKSFNYSALPTTSIIQASKYACWFETNGLGLELLYPGVSGGRIG